MKLVWISSGDEIELVPYNQLLGEYYCTQLNQHALVCDHSDVDASQHDQLLDYLQIVNQFFAEKNIDQKFESGDPYDQQYLNDLHRKWVKFHLANPAIITVLANFDQSLVQKFRGINSTLHKIEKMFVQSYYGVEHGEVLTWTNPFDNSTAFSTSNIQIFYNDLGRNTYNKWINFDDQLDDIDTNDYKKLAAEIRVNLNRSEQLEAPDNYVQWCRKHGLNEIPGRWINLGDFKNLQENLADYRKLMVRNNQQPISIVL